MAEPFRNSTLPSLIDFGNEENDDSSFDEWSRNEDSMAEKTNNPREKHLTSLGSLMESRSDSAPFEFNKIDRRNRDHHEEFRPQFDNDGSSTNHQPSTNPFQSPQSTLDQFLCTNQQPTFTSLPPGVLEDDDTMYTQITTHASSLSLKASGVSSSEKINNPNPSSSGHRRSGASSFDSLKFSEQEFVNARSSFSSAEANDLPEVTTTTDTFQVPEMKWVEFDDFDTIKSRDEERDDFMYAGHVPGHRKTSSYGQQPVWQASNGDMIKRSGMRKHSLDEKMPKHLTNMYHSAERSRSETYAINGDRLHGNPFLDDLKVEGIPEFIGNGGGEGIYKAPVRAAIHPGRPPSFELRPHPLRETQVGRFMRTINYMDGQLWAGTECGIRFWNLSEVFMNCGEEGLVPGDEETAPFYESSKTSPTLCLLPDVSSKLIWTGHKDGKIRTWKMDVDNSDGHMVKQIIAWQAHKGPVFCLAMTSYGDLWSGSEAGATKVWPGEAVEKALSLVDQGRHMAVIGIERSFIDLKSQVTVGGVCCLPPYDVKFMLADTRRGKVWSGAYLTFALWDARTRDLLKVYGLDGQSEIRADTSSIHDSNVEDEMKVKFVTSTKKEKPQSSLNFFQRSRNALIGAADAVRRVAAKGPFGDDVRRTEALVISMDGMIWTGCANGSLVQWDGNGNRVQEFHHHPYPVQCMCTTGTRIWIGYASGMVQIINIDGKLLGGWVAHGSAVMKIVVGSGYVFTLAHHGGIRAWSMSSPHPLDEIVRTELSKKDYLYMKQENIRILAGTWNVGQERASPDSLISWIGSSASDVAIVVVGFQEVEMGAGVLAMAAAKESVGLEGSANGQWWLENIGKTLDEGTTFERVGSRQLAGLLIAIWVRKSLQPYIGDMDVAAVPCGFGRAIGNKGAVALKMRVFHRIFCFVNCHFAAHLEAVNRRNADFDHVYRTMVFSRSTNAMTAVAAGVSSAVHYLRGVNIPGMQPEENKPELADSDMVVFLGDFNYRLHSISYDEARDFVSQRCFDWLREKDQLRAEMKAGRVFQGMREGVITFPPTYKFERHVSGLAGYDSSEKKRIPAWCDRILYRDNRGSSSLQCSLECPVVSSIIHYDACMDATDSDHKPVRCIFQVDIARIDEWIRRHEFGNIILSNASIQSMLREVNVVPEAVVSTNNILLQNQEKSVLRITNKCSKSKAVFWIVCKGENTIKDDGTTEFKQRNAYGLPRWLQVSPATGVIRPGQVFEVTVHHEEHTQEEFIDGKPQNWWCEDTRDKEVMLEVNVSGSGSMEVRSHQVWVRHCISSKSSSSSKEQAKRAHANHLQRTDNKQIPESSDIVENLKTRNWHNP